MNRRWSLPVVAVLTGLTLLGTSGAALATDRSSARNRYHFAVIGDIPYGAEQVTTFPGVVDQINEDRRVSTVAHLGDIKSGSMMCTDEYFDNIRTQFDRFEDPLVYTPGDNEWTDCHRPNNGAYDPLERLDAIRDTFFDDPGYSLGEKPARLVSQERSGYPENVRYRRAGVSFAVPHIVGSNNGMAARTGLTAPTPEQAAEVLGRTAAAIELIRDAFGAARRNSDRAVVVMTQADMFDPTVATPEYASYYAFTPIVRALAEESADFDGEVYLLNGDSHVFNEDRPLASGSKWLEFYGLEEPVDTLQRVTVDGSENNTNYLRFTVRPRQHDVLSWTKVPYTG